METDRPCYQIGELQPIGVRLLIANHNVERVRHPSVILAVAYPLKRQLEIGVLLRAMCLTHDVRQRLVLPLEVQEVPHTLQTVLDADVIRVVGIRVALRESPLVDHDRRHRHRYVRDDLRQRV